MNFFSLADSNIDIENEGLQQQVEIIELPNLEPEDFNRLREAQNTRDTLFTTGHETSFLIEQTIVNFIAALEKEYEDKHINQCALYHVLVGNPPHEDVHFVDFEGEHSIESFLQNLKSEHLA